MEISVLTDDPDLHNLICIALFSDLDVRKRAVKSRGCVISHLNQSIPTMASMMLVNKTWNRASMRLWHGLSKASVAEVPQEYQCIVECFVRLMCMFREEMLDLAKLRWDMGLTELQYNLDRIGAGFTPHVPQLSASNLLAHLRKLDEPLPPPARASRNGLWPEEVICAGAPRELAELEEWIVTTNAVLADDAARWTLSDMPKALSDFDTWDSPWNRRHECEYLYEMCGRYGMPLRSPVTMIVGTQLQYKLEWLTFWSTLFMMMVDHAAQFAEIPTWKCLPLCEDQSLADRWDYCKQYRTQLLSSTSTVIERFAPDHCKHGLNHTKLARVIQARAIDSMFDTLEGITGANHTPLYRVRCVWMALVNPNAPKENRGLYQRVVSKIDFVHHAPGEDPLREWAKNALQAQCRRHVERSKMGHKLDAKIFKRVYKRGTRACEYDDWQLFCANKRFQREFIEFTLRQLSFLCGM